MPVILLRLMQICKRNAVCHVVHAILDSSFCLEKGECVALDNVQLNFDSCHRLLFCIPISGCLDPSQA